VLEVMKALPTLAKEAIERSQDRARHPPVPPAAPPVAPTPAANNTRRDLLIASAALIPASVLWLGLQINPEWPGALLCIGGVLILAAAILRA
jgi:hypothetical protein